MAAAQSQDHDWNETSDFLKSIEHCKAPPESGRVEFTPFDYFITLPAPYLAEMNCQANHHHHCRYRLRLIRVAICWIGRCPTPTRQMVFINFGEKRDRKRVSLHSLLNSFRHIFGIVTFFLCLTRVYMLCEFI